MSAPNFFVPSSQIIAGILPIGRISAVLTVTPHGYQEGMVVKFVVPPIPGVGPLVGTFGMTQMNGIVAEIASILAPAAFTVNVDSSGFDPYNLLLAPIESNDVFGLVIPIAEDALTVDYAVHNNNNIIPETTPIIPLNPKVTA